LDVTSDTNTMSFMQIYCQYAKRQSKTDAFFNQNTELIVILVRKSRPTLVAMVTRYSAKHITPFPHYHTVNIISLH